MRIVVYTSLMFVGISLCLNLTEQCHMMQINILQYTWTNDRLWRKNRRIIEGSSCDGVDLNRNYNDHWNGVCFTVSCILNQNCKCFLIRT